jgi:hypothetical protein
MTSEKWAQGSVFLHGLDLSFCANDPIPRRAHVPARPDTKPGSRATSAAFAHLGHAYGKYKDGFSAYFINLHFLQVRLRRS